MTSIVIELIGLSVLLVLLGAGLMVVCRRVWRDAPAVDVLLASMLLVPLALLAMIVGVGKLPFHRPLDYLPFFQGAMSMAAGFAAWRRRRALAAEFRSLRDGMLDAWVGSNIAQRVTLVIGVVAFATTAAFGVWMAPWGIDELIYHVPQALQPFRDGRIGPSLGSAPWTDSYPRGGALLYYWTFALTHNDAGFHAVNSAFGALFAVATVSASRRAGLSRSHSLVAGVIATACPTLLFLMVIGYVDLIASGIVAAMIAFSLPDRRTPRESDHDATDAEAISDDDIERAGIDSGAGWSAWSWPSAVMFLIAGMMAPWVKIAAICPSLWLMGVRGLVALLFAIRGRGPWLATRATPGVFGLAAAGLLACGLMSIPYVQTALRYGAPFHPMELKIAGVTLSEGYFTTAHFNQDSDVPFLRRFATYWGHVTLDSNLDRQGQMGPVFLFLMLPGIVLAIVRWMRSPSVAWTMLLASFLGVFLMPQHHVARYSLFIILPGAVALGAMTAMIRVRALGLAAATVVLSAQVASLVPQGKFIRNTFKWCGGFKVPLWTSARSKTVYSQISSFGPKSPAPVVRHAVYDIMQPGERLVYAVYGLDALLWDWDFSYPVEFRPAKEWETHWVKPWLKGYGEKEGVEWAKRLYDEKVAAAMVYKDSGEDIALSNPKSGYVLVIDQPPKDEPQYKDIDRPGIRVYRLASLVEADRKRRSPYGTP